MQLSLFDGVNQFKIEKPIRLIELFAGYGSQALALKYLGVSFESYKIAEWAVKSIQAYKDMHFTDDNTDYSESLTKDEIINYLYAKGISADYNQPMTLQQIQRLGEDKARQIYNNIQATHNLVSVCNMHGKDLDVIDTDKYCYIMTYSFPCQDLSSAGLGKGMGRDSGTRSGLLWEVERILKELHEDNKPLPQVLLMENVPEVIGTKNIKHFAEWVKTLDELGYHSKWKLLNAKDYEIPQNRNRCFMVSILGDYYYEFPQPKPLKLRLKDMLEDNVDEKYYLSNKTIDMFVKHTEKKQAEGCGFKFEPTDGDSVAHSILTRSGERPCDNYIKCEQVAQITDSGFTEMTGRVYSQQGLSPSIRTFAGGNTEVKVMEEPKIIQRPHGYNQGLDTRADCLGVCTNYRIRKLTPKECFRLMGVKDEDYEKVAKNQSNSSLYHLAGDSIVVNVLMALFNQML